MAPKIVLPNMEFSFEVSVTGETTNQLYQGKFLYKRPNLGVIRQIKTTKARLNEDLRNLDEESTLLNEMLSWLQYTIVEAPPWWNMGGWDLYDMNIVVEIYTKVLQFENNFRNKIEEIGKSETSESKDETSPTK